MTVAVLVLMIVAAVQGASLPFSELGFPDNALEPYIDTLTMVIHHDKHYAGQVRGVNAALAECGINVTSYSQLVSDVLPLVGSDDVPEECPDTWPTLVRAVRNSGGGAFNHHFFWLILAPAYQSKTTDIGEDLLADLESTFGGVDEFQEQFSSACLSVFGSGWCYLVLDDKELKIIITANQDNPYMSLDSLECSDEPASPSFPCDEQKELGNCWASYMVPAGNCLKTCKACKTGSITPLLNLDMWEHAHYLLRQNRRAEYVDAFFNVINWKEVNNAYNKAMSQK